MYTLTTDPHEEIHPLLLTEWWKKGCDGTKDNALLIMQSFPSNNSSFMQNPISNPPDLKILQVLAAIYSDNQSKPTS